MHGGATALEEGINVIAKTTSDREKIKALPWNLVHGVLTNIFYLWTFGGSVFLLFLSELGLPKGQIGILLSLFPFSGLVALGFAPVAARLGWKRVFVTCYSVRYFVMVSLLLLPWILAQAGYTAGVVFLFSVITLFAILRALGETAYYPWSQEFIPNRVRGKFTAIYTVLGTLASSVALITAGVVIGAGEGLGRFLLLLAAGCFLGLIGIIVMWKIPGGEPIAQAEASSAHLANMTEALRDRNFVAYLGGLGGVTIGGIFLTSFLPLYIKDQIGLASGAVVTLDTAMMIGGGVSSLLWGWAADRVGSRPVLMPAITMTLLVPLGWLLLPRQAPHAMAWCAVLNFVYGMATSGIGIGAGRLLFNAVISPAKSTAYTAIFYAWMGITGGMAPLLAGIILSVCAGWNTRIGVFVVDGYTLLFILALVLLSFGWWQYSRVKPDDIYTTRAVLRRFAAKLQPPR